MKKKDILEANLESKDRTESEATAGTAPIVNVGTREPHYPSEDQFQKALQTTKVLHSNLFRRLPQQGCGDDSL